MVKQRTPNSQDERSSRSAYAIISSVSSAGRTARLGREGRVFKSPTGELSTGCIMVMPSAEDRKFGVQFPVGGLCSGITGLYVNSHKVYSDGPTPSIPINRSLMVKCAALNR